MFYCTDCGREFEKMLRLHSIDGSKYDRLVCPHCGGEDISRDIGKCDQCGAYLYPGETMYKLISVPQILFCENCIERLG